jgi:hypothetical protein
MAQRQIGQALQSVHARAGNGVIKAIDGIDPKATSSIAEDQLKSIFFHQEHKKKL